MGKHKVTSKRYHDRWVNTNKKGHSAPLWNTHGTPTLFSIVVPNPRKRGCVAQVFDFARGEFGEVVHQKFFFEETSARHYCENYIDLYKRAKAA